MRDTPGIDSRVLARQRAIPASAAVTPVSTGNRARLLEDGPETYAAMMAAIRAARHHVNLESFIFDDRLETGREFRALLGEKCAEGVAVNLIYDALGSRDTRTRTFARLAECGVRCLPVHPLAWWQSRGRRWSPFYRDHRKLLIVDGCIAFTGGINIDEVYDAKHEECWRDTHLELRGPIVAELQKLFLAQWQEQGSERLPDARYFPALAPCGEVAVRIVATSPGDTGAAFHEMLLAAIGDAERRIWVTQAYFAPPPHVDRALVEAAQRGVDVRLILPQHTDQAIVVWAGRAHYAALLDAGVRIFERGEVTLHAKTVVIDGLWSVVGSANLDYRSVLYNDEANAIVFGRAFGAGMEAMFERDLAASAEVTPEAWARRSLAARAKERGARLLEAWL